MESFVRPVAAGIIVGLLNRYVLDFKWCADLEAWCQNVDEDEDAESDTSSSSFTAINSDALVTHHVVTHVH